MLLRIIPPLPELRRYFLHFMLLSLDGCESHLPAWLSVNLTLAIRGGGALMREDGSIELAPRFCLSGPSPLPVRTRAEPGTLALSVMFRPGLAEDAWGVPVSDLVERVVAVDAVLGSERVELLLDEVDATPDWDAKVDTLQRFLLTTLRDPPRRRTWGTAFLAAEHRLFHPLVDLALYFGVGERQLERHVRRAFGLPLREVRRLARFGRALPAFLGGKVSRGSFTHLAQEAGFFDQAHMHREFVELCGLGPMELLTRIRSGDPSFWVFRMTEQQFQKLYVPQ